MYHETPYKFPMELVAYRMTMGQDCGPHPDQEDQLIA